MGSPSSSSDWLSAQVPTLSSLPLATLKAESIFILSSELIPPPFSVFPLHELYSIACFLLLWLQQAFSLQYLNVSESFPTFRKPSLSSTVAFNSPLSFTAKLTGVSSVPAVSTSLSVLVSTLSPTEMALVSIFWPVTSPTLDPARQC